MPKNTATYGHKKPRKKPGKQWIEVGNGKFALIDEEDYARVDRYKWVWKEKKQVHSIGFKDSRENLLQVKLRRLLKQDPRYFNLKYFILEEQGKKGFTIYHLDGNKLNFCKDNLRLVTLKEAVALDNQFNRRKSRKKRVETKRINYELVGFDKPRKPLTKRSVDNWIKFYYDKYQKVPTRGCEFTDGWNWSTINDWIRKNYGMSTGLYMKKKLGFQTRAFQPFTIPLIRSWIKDFFVQTGRPPIVSRDKKSRQSTDGRTWIAVDRWLMVEKGTSLYELTGRKKRDGKA